jgi:hypothetical protein
MALVDVGLDDAGIKSDRDIVLSLISIICSGPR